MACVPGRYGRAKSSFDGGENFDIIGGAVDINMNGNVDELECTSKDSMGQRTYLPGHVDFTLDLVMRWDEEDPEQVALLDTLLPWPTEFKIQFMLENKVGKRLFEGDCFITSYNPTSPNDDISGLDITVRFYNVIIDTVA